MSRALAMIRGCIDAVRWSTVSTYEASDDDVVAKGAAEQFLYNVRVWLRAVRRASEKRWRPSEAWHFGFRQHLGLIIGAIARSELGRAASHKGNRMLADEFRIMFGNHQPHQPVFGEPQRPEHDCKDDELAATFHSLPEDLRYGQDAAARLLAIVVRLVELRPQHLDEAAEPLGKLCQMLKCFETYPSRRAWTRDKEDA